MITKDMTIEDIFTEFPHKSQKLAAAMSAAGLHCVGCSASTWETIEMGMQGHGFDEKAIDGLLKQLNQIIEEQEDLTTVSITESAAKKYQAILAEENKTG